MFGLLKRLKVKISDVHIRYQDSELGFSAGVKLNSVQFKTTTPSDVKVQVIMGIYDG